MRAGNRHYRTSRVQNEKRTIPVPAQGDEDGRYFKCWYCGFICDKRKNALDDGKPGNASRPATITSGRILGDLNSVRFRVGIPIILRQLDLLGNPKPIYIERRVVIGSGCPNCGTHNYS